MTEACTVATLVFVRTAKLLRSAFSLSEQMACPTSKFIYYTCDSKDARWLCGL